MVTGVVGGSSAGHADTSSEVAISAAAHAGAVGFSVAALEGGTHARRVADSSDVAAEAAAEAKRHVRRATDAHDYSRAIGSLKENQNGSQLKFKRKKMTR